MLNKQTVVNELRHAQELLEAGNPGAAQFTLRKLENQLNGGLVFDDGFNFHGIDCTDLVQSYRNGEIPFGTFLREVRQRGGGSIAELKEFAEPIRTMKINSNGFDKVLDT